MVRTRKQPTPWMHRNSRYLLAGGATAGLCLSIGCLAKGSSEIAGSAYITLMGVSLPLLGVIAYGLVAALALLPSLTKNKALDGITWQGLFVGTTAMAIFSGYLLYVMFAILQEPCLPCMVSAFLSLGLWGLTLLGRRWDDLGQLLLSGVCVVTVAGLITTGLYAYASDPDAFNTVGHAPKTITTESSNSEIALAQHLTAIGAKKYGAWWCPHCHAQQELFGKAAFDYVTYVECDEEGVDPQPQACRAAGVQSYPTWEINGETYAGVQSLEFLAISSGYTGSQDFINSPAPHE